MDVLGIYSGVEFAEPNHPRDSGMLLYKVIMISFGRPPRLCQFEICRV